MKKFSLLLNVFVIYVFATSSCVKDRVQPTVITPPDTSLGTRQLIHYWNFNSDDTTQMLLPNYSIGGGSISYLSSYYDAVTPGSSFNLRNHDSEGNGLRMRNPFTSITFGLPTSGYKQPVMIFSAQRSSSGPTGNNIYYTLDGTNFINNNIITSSISIDTLWAVYSIDFSSVEGANNNPNFAVQLISTNNNTGTSGNDRYDNVTLNAYKQ